VDDNPVNLKLVNEILTLAGFETYQSTDAEQAQEILTAHFPDLILMDIALPGMDGLELTRILKADKRTGHIPIIAVSAFAMKSDMERASAAGCNGFITKPIDTRTFVTEISKYL
jgi:CheY-like chemotaxis protein